MVPGSVWISQCQFNYVDQNEEIQSITGEEFDQPLEQVAGSLWVEPGANDSWSLCYICENQHKHTIPLVFDHEISDQQVPGSIWINDDKVYVALDLYGQRQAQIPSSVQAQIPVQAPSINGVTITTNTGVIQLQFSDLIYGLLENQTVSPQGKITNGYDNSNNDLITDLNFQSLPWSTTQERQQSDKCGNFGTRFTDISLYNYTTETYSKTICKTGIGAHFNNNGIYLYGYNIPRTVTYVLTFKPSSQMAQQNPNPYDQIIMDTGTFVLRMTSYIYGGDSNGSLVLDADYLGYSDRFVQTVSSESARVQFDQWNTIIVTRDDERINVYLNGRKIISTPYNQYTQTMDIEIFRTRYYTVPPCPFIGDVDSFKVYSKQFSSKDQSGEYQYGCPSQKYALIQRYRTPWVYIPSGVTITDYVTDMTTPEGTMIIQDHDKDNRVGDRVWLIQNSVAGQQYGNVYQQLPTDTYTKTTELPVGPIYVAAEYTLYYPEQ